MLARRLRFATAIGDAPQPDLVGRVDDGLLVSVDAPLYAGGPEGHVDPDAGFPVALRHAEGGAAEVEERTLCLSESGRVGLARLHPRELGARLVVAAHAVEHVADFREHQVGVIVVETEDDVGGRGRLAGDGDGDSRGRVPRRGFRLLVARGLFREEFEGLPEVFERRRVEALPLVKLAEQVVRGGLPAAVVRLLEEAERVVQTDEGLRRLAPPQQTLALGQLRARAARGLPRRRGRGGA